MERFDSGRFSTTLVILCILLCLFRYTFYILLSFFNILQFQVCMDYGTIDCYIETIRASCIEFTEKSYFALFAARIYPRTPRTDVKLDSFKFAEGSSFSGCPAIVGCIIFRMRHNRDFIYEDAFSGLNKFFFYQ